MNLELAPPLDPLAALDSRLSAIVDSEDQQIDALALTEPINSSGSSDPEEDAQRRQLEAARLRIEQEEAARRRVAEEVDRREAEDQAAARRRSELSGLNALPSPVVNLDDDDTDDTDTEPLQAGTVEEAVRLVERRSRSRSQTESMFVAPRPAPVVEDDDDDDRVETPAVASITGEYESRIESDQPAEHKLVAGGEREAVGLAAPSALASPGRETADAPAPRTRPPSEPRRLASPAPRTESWRKPPSLAELGLDFARPRPAQPEPSPTANEPPPTSIATAEPDIPITTEESSPEPAANQAPSPDSRRRSERYTIDSANQNQTSGVIGRLDRPELEEPEPPRPKPRAKATPKKDPDDEFAPVEVKIAEPARESSVLKRPPELGAEGPRRESSMPTEKVAALEVEADTDTEEIEPTEVPPTGGSRAGLWIMLLLVGAVIAGVAFKDQLFGSGKGPAPVENPKPDKTQIGKTQTDQPTPDEIIPDPIEPGDSGSEPIADTAAAETGVADPIELSRVGPDPGPAELSPEILAQVEADLSSARRYLKGYRRKDKAIELIDRILAVAPDHAPTLVLRAEILINEGKLDDALAAATRAKLAAPDLPEVFYMLGALLKEANDKPAAAEAYRRYLELDPTGRQAAEVKSELARIERELGK